MPHYPTSVGGREAQNLSVFCLRKGRQVGIIFSAGQLGGCLTAPPAGGVSAICFRFGEVTFFRLCEAHMNKQAAAHSLDQNAILSLSDITKDEFQKTGLEWSRLDLIFQHHIARTDELRHTADYLSHRLQKLPEVHSLKLRIKNPEHLIGKIIRKKSAKPERCFDVDSYQQEVTDLIGIRAIHLFKNQWRPIHEFIKNTWELHEEPIAYVRKGDPQQWVKEFTEVNCKIEEHDAGYRSIHYIIKSQPARCVHFAELQVRTIFEEGWSEIDHQIRYPCHSDDPHLAEFLTIFNRLAGSADEMGSFIKRFGELLDTHAAALEAQTRQNKEQTALIAEQKSALTNMVSQLKISEEQRSELQRKIEDFSKASERGISVVASTRFPVVTESPGILAHSALLNLAQTTVPLAMYNLPSRTCTSCSRVYQELPGSVTLVYGNGLCPECRQRSALLR